MSVLKSCFPHTSWWSPYACLLIFRFTFQVPPPFFVPLLQLYSPIWSPPKTNPFLHFLIPSYTSVIYIYIYSWSIKVIYADIIIVTWIIMKMMYSNVIFLSIISSLLQSCCFFVFLASGKIRAAIGKANLLVNQKFKQFAELCYEHMVRNGVLHIIVISGCRRDRMVAGFTTTSAISAYRH